MSSASSDKKLVQVWLENDIIDIFDSLKTNLRFKNDSEVLRYAIVYTEKRMPK